MSWTYPHTVTTYQVTSTVDGTTKLEGNPAVGTGADIAADFQPNATPGKVFQDWGIELVNPAVMFVAIANFGSIGANTRVLYNGTTYVVINSKKWETGQSDLDYAKAVLERVNE